MPELVGTSMDRFALQFIYNARPISALCEEISKTLIQGNFYLHATMALLYDADNKKVVWQGLVQSFGSSLSPMDAAYWGAKFQERLLFDVRSYLPGYESGSIASLSFNPVENKRVNLVPFIIEKRGKINAA